MALKRALTIVAALSVIAHPPALRHAPPQLEKTEPASAVAVSDTTVPELNVAEHVDPHDMPVGLDETVPDPVPIFIIVKD